MRPGAEIAVVLFFLREVDRDTVIFSCPSVLEGQSANARRQVVATAVTSLLTMSLEDDPEPVVTAVICVVRFFGRMSSRIREQPHGLRWRGQEGVLEAQARGLGSDSAAAHQEQQIERHLPPPAHREGAPAPPG